MQNCDLKSMSIDELWALHEEVVDELGRKIAAEKVSLEERLRKLNSIPSLAKMESVRRPPRWVRDCSDPAKSSMSFG
jgi:DNA-binding protein H-NS